MLAKLQKHLRHQEIIIVMFLLSICVFKFPLQHYITLARFQHYGICLYVWALGFVLQAICSWRKLSNKGRLCLLSTGIYIGTFAAIFCESPWLDARMAVQTEEQDILRVLYAVACALLGFMVSVTWLAWVLEKKPADSEKSS